MPTTYRYIQIANRDRRPNAPRRFRNLSKLVIGGSGKTAVATRLSLLALGDAKGDAQADRVRYQAITPDTSFKLGNGGGAVRERALIYWAIRSELRWKGLDTLLRECAGVRTWGDQLGSIDQVRPDKAIIRTFADDVLADQPLLETLHALVVKARRGAQDQAFRKARSAAIGQLRAKLAAAGVEAIAPTCLVVVDEFQKFPDLLRSVTGTASLAQTLAARLFRSGDPRRRVLLLSATPYRLPGVDADPGEKPYDSFVDLIRFMAGDRDADALSDALGSFAGALQASEPDAVRIEAAKAKAQTILRKVMTRTERVSWTQDADSMVAQRLIPLPAEPEDLRGAVAARKVARLLGAQDSVEYWKSAPYFLDFMRDYQFRKLATATVGKDRRALINLAKDRLLLNQTQLRRMRRAEIPNARLRNLIQDALPEGAEQLLWVPSSLPYLEPGGVFRNSRPDLKRLIFSEWRLAPDAIASLTSYEAERRLADQYTPQTHRGRRRAKSSPNRAHADFGKHGELLRLGRASKGQSLVDQHPAALALLIPSLTLGSIGDPLRIALAKRGRVPFAAAIRSVRAVVGRKLASLPAGKATGRVDERWYWAAPLLLDRDAARGWLAMRDPLGQRMEKDGHLDLAPGMLAIVSDPSRLGFRPSDLDRVLAMLAIAGPAICAARALQRTVAGEQLAPDVYRAAFHVARGFRTLFNQADATLAVQNGRYREPAYWRQVLRCAADGNLQSLLDEHLHIAADALSLFEGTLSRKIEKAAGGLYEALTLRRALVEVSGLERRRGRSVESVHLRCGHALRFAEIKEPDGGVSRLDVVRAAFNSPFRPFAQASTTLGQEGLDFHPWCHAVVHWNLPRSPVELEQREGRVHRYKGQAVRLNVASAVGLAELADHGAAPSDDPWVQMFALAAMANPTNELAPSWLFEHGDNPHRIQRIVPFPELSRESEQWPRLQARLVIYRLVMGLPRQEELLSALEGQVTIDQARAWTIDLRPP